MNLKSLLICLDTKLKRWDSTNNNLKGPQYALFCFCSNLLLVEHGKHKLNIHKWRSATSKTHGSQCNVSNEFQQCINCI